MYDNLKSLGVNHLDDIDRYSLRQEANNDILKIYFRRTKTNFSPKTSNSNIPVSVRPWCLIMRRKATGKSTK